jgi:hypothetical protein
MTNQQHEVHGTAPIPAEKDVSHAAITINRPLADVEAALQRFAVPGMADVQPAPGDKGVEIRVQVDKATADAAAGVLGTYEGHTVGGKLKNALRLIKAQLETGEVPTVDGQPSGRD